MIKKVINALRKVIVAFLVLYGFNILVSSINIFIPINVISVLIVSILGIPGLLSLVVLFLII